MCQLLGMNCNVPTDICFSFTGFRQRGGSTDVHSDGWGIAFFEGKGVRLFVDPQASAESTIAELVRSYPIHSLNVVAHIRKATQGVTSLENTHPFMRELWGRYWLFAHNGNLPHFQPQLDGSYVPVGNTDSEQTFCWMLQSLRQRFGTDAPSRQELFDALGELSLPLAGMGIFNFLLSNGDCLVAHCSTELSYIIRRAPFAEAHLKDQDISIDFRQVTTPEDRVAIIATQPLTDNEPWVNMRPGTLWMFHDGEVVGQQNTVPSPFKSLAEMLDTERT
ncbi:glutamine amidotransferase, putative [Syntrophotalea carbinolica DSM 2380]|uniref:Glutamine amidotransferase, putative n=1 Tax=Syntrophotalea carbinolica (strain DSM 2380 / NBRC 103641 / GraBd1) TaxID=338963 RepID=Q3A260_SYNC1|nr:class II glutamine amidotransferase [Syntrophotalea carbinolica]ABA89547.1 glutamine amidotransferase, putative [Syntrophotalea carbinolica DSM 2380]